MREVAISYAISLPKAANEQVVVEANTLIKSPAARVIPSVSAVVSDAPTVTVLAM